MEIEYKNRTISFTKEPTIYDLLVLEFSEILQRQKIKHVFVSGYIALLFGRSRISEDVYLLVERHSFDDFKLLWKTLDKDFYCHNTADAKIAYDKYLDEDLAIRFSKMDVVIPNIEFKWAATEQHKQALEEFLTVILNGKAIIISSLEIQIAYKLYLNSDKDIEDARYLFELFREKLDLQKLKKEITNLNLSIQDVKSKLGWEP